jgi:hypothetical protein
MIGEELSLVTRPYFDLDGIECLLSGGFVYEKYHETAVIGQTSQRRGIMAWACFAGAIKGPLVIWDPERGTLNSNTFIEHIVPKIDQFNCDLWENYQIDALLMQDRAPCHWSYQTTEELYGLDISGTDHPPISPDLNPQEDLWNWLKDYVSSRCVSHDIGYRGLAPII